MKKITIIIMITMINLYAERLTFNDLSEHIADKYNKTIIIDESIKTDFLIYSNQLKEDITITMLQLLAEDLNYNFLEFEKVIRISNKTKNDIKINEKNIKIKEKIEDEKYERNIKQIQTKFIISNLKKKTFLEICKTMTYECTYVGNSKYLVTSKLQEINENIFNSKIRKKYKLAAKIYEIDKNKIDEQNINLNGILNMTKDINNGKGILNLLGKFGQNYSETNNNIFTLDLIFEFFEKIGLARSISSPTLSLTDDTEVSFISGDQITIQNQVTNDTDTNIKTTSYSNVDVGISIKVTPIYLNNESIDIDLSLEITSLLNYDKEKNIASMSKKSLNGTYNLFINDQIKLVQFSQKQNNKITHQVPLLNVIPLVGSLFKSETYSESEKIIIITLKLLEERNKNINNIIIKNYDKEILTFLKEV